MTHNTMMTITMLHLYCPFLNRLRGKKFSVRAYTMSSIGHHSGLPGYDQRANVAIGTLRSTTSTSFDGVL